VNRRSGIALTLLMAAFSIPVAAQDGTLFVEGDNVGIGVSTPIDRLHIESGLLRVGGHTTGERVGIPIDFQISGLRNVIYIVDSNNDSTNANFVVSIDGNPNAVIFQAREDRRIRFNGASATTTTHPLVVGTDSTNGNGAHLTAGGSWVNSSSRASKQGVVELAVDEAVAALGGLSPVKFRYVGEPDEQYVGFIAEDVPEVVAQGDRKTIGSMDIVAVLTRVVQDQQQRLAQLEAELKSLREQAP
jgi:hypothetical protein